MITDINLTTGVVTYRAISDEEKLSFPMLSPEDIAAEKRRVFKQERELAVASIIVEVDGLLFDGDETSQERMARAMLVMQEGETTLWVLATNESVQVTREHLRAALRLAGAEQTRLWAYQG